MLLAEILDQSSCTGHKKYGFRFYEKSYPAIQLQWDHRYCSSYIGESALILPERSDFRSPGTEKWNLLLKTFKMSPQTSPNSLSFTHINFLRLSEIVGQSHCNNWVKILGLELKPIPNLTKFWSESDNFSVVFHRVPRFRPMSTNRSQFIKNLSFFIRLETPGRSRHEKVIPDRNYHILHPPVRNLSSGIFFYRADLEKLDSHQNWP